MTQLSYYFNDQTSFYYNDIISIFSGSAIEITMPNNNSSLSVIQISNTTGMPSYYTLNSIYITLTSTYDNAPVNNSTYQLILQGNLNDYKNDTINKLIIIIPIFTEVSNTTEGKPTPLTNINNEYLNNLFENMQLHESYNYLSGMDINNFLSGSSSAIMYDNVSDTNLSNINFKVIQCKESNLWTNKEFSLSSLLSFKTRIPNTTPFSINLLNNGKSITTIAENDIYIDCSPTNNIGERVDVYTSKDLDQLKMFKVNDLKVWAFRFITIFVILIIIFIIIKIFQINDPAPTPDQGISH
jgi:hypothetical protein